MRFVYKQESVYYEDLLVGTREAETEWTENKSIPVRMRSTILNEEVGLKDLQKEVEALTAALNSTAFQGAKPKKGNAPPPRISKLRRAKPQKRLIKHLNQKGHSLQQLDHSHTQIDPCNVLSVEDGVMGGEIALPRET